MISRVQIVISNRCKSKKWNISQCMNANTLFKSSSTWARARDFRYFPFQYFKRESYGKMQMVIRKHLLGK